MNVTLKTVELYSAVEGKIVKWKVEPREETDEGGNVHQIIAVTYKEEIHRVSPNAQDSDIQNMVKQINEENQNGTV